MLARQKASFRKLLEYVWDHSVFYREFYRSHGIEKPDLASLTVRDLPLVSKKLLMDNFDAAVTDSRLRKRELEQWIHEHPDPRESYKRDFIVVHSSGSSGNIGVFVYDRKAWQRANCILASYLPGPENKGSAKIRAAYYIAAHGHFAAVSRATRMPADAYDLLIVSVLDPVDEVVSRLNAFQPEQLGGYSSSVATLAEMARNGRLRITPRRVFVGADKLTPGMEQTIREAWNAPLYSLYSASESCCIAVKRPGEEAMVVIDANIVEVLNETDRPAAVGGSGRVVLTNLCNTILPVARYDLGDRVVLGNCVSDASPTIQSIEDRPGLELPVMLNDNSCDHISQMVLRELFVPGAERFQFVSRRPDHVDLLFTGSPGIDTAVQKAFERILTIKRASRTRVEVRRVERLEITRKTGKFDLVKLAAAESSEGAKA